MQVFRSLLAVLPTNPRVVSFMVDFEKAIWKALRSAFPDTVVKGCVFHLTQAIWRQVQERGLQSTYNAKKRTHSLRVNTFRCKSCNVRSSSVFTHSWFYFESLYTDVYPRPIIRHVHAVLCCCCRRLMALVFLPAEHISPAFSVLQDSIQRHGDQRLKDLADYVEKHWIQSSVWPPQCWSAYKETVCTNNDTEGLQGLFAITHKKTIPFSRY